MSTSMDNVDSVDNVDGSMPLEKETLEHTEKTYYSYINIVLQFINVLML